MDTQAKNGRSGKFKEIKYLYGKSFIFLSTTSYKKYASLLQKVKFTSLKQYMFVIYIADIQQYIIITA